MIESVMARGNRFWIAIAALVLLGVLEWTTLGAETIRVINGPNGEPLLDVSVRGVALAILLVFALRICIHRRREMLEERGKKVPGRSEL
jgi:hypothetical protein